jgi:hypothetical protein
MKTKILTCGIRIDDNRSINCGVSIVNQNNTEFNLWYDRELNEFAFEPKKINGYFMSDVNAYLTALNDIITAMAEANKFVTK